MFARSHVQDSTILLVPLPIAKIHNRVQVRHRVAWRCPLGQRRPHWMCRPLPQLHGGTWLGLRHCVGSPAGDLKYSLDAPEFSTIVQPFMLVSYLLIILRTGWYMYMSGDDAALARVRVVKYREGVRLPLDNRTAR